MKKFLLGLIFGLVTGMLFMEEKTRKIIKNKEKWGEKFKTYYDILNQWMTLLYDNKSIATYFIENNYKTIAIYGMGKLGILLYKELEKSEIKVKYCIEKNPNHSYPDIEIKCLGDEFEKVDVVVITAVSEFNNIVKNIKEKVDSPIISLEDIVYEI